MMRLVSMRPLGVSDARERSVLPPGSSAGAGLERRGMLSLYFVAPGRSTVRPADPRGGQLLSGKHGVLSNGLPFLSIQNLPSYGRRPPRQRPGQAPAQRAPDLRRNLAPQSRNEQH